MSHEQEILKYVKRERNNAIARAKDAIVRARKALDDAGTAIDAGADGIPWRKDDAYFAFIAAEAASWSACAVDLIDQYATIKLIVRNAREEEVDEVIHRLQPAQRFWFNTSGGVMVGGVYRDEAGKWFGYDEEATIDLEDIEEARTFVRQELLPDPGALDVNYGVEAYS